jgi:peptidoglycan/xylan/chitin deacetylase (PgdA/CDA1 family)
MAMKAKTISTLFTELTQYRKKTMLRCILFAALTLTASGVLAQAYATPAPAHRSWWSNWHRSSAPQPTNTAVYGNYQQPQASASASYAKSASQRSSPVSAETARAARGSSVQHTSRSSSSKRDSKSATSKKEASADKEKGNEGTKKTDEEPDSASKSANINPAVISWPTGKKLIALTYDDGPNPRITPRMLALLKKKNVKATFFLLGEQVREYPKVVKQILEEGHEIGNHTYDHKQLTKLSSDQIEKELGRTADLITSVTGQKMEIMRPPYGSHNNRVREICEKYGYRVILWDVDTNDWRGRSAKQMISTILNGSKTDPRATDGSIILMHDRYETGLVTTDAVIDALRDKGYQFVTVSQLLSNPKFHRGGTNTASETSGVVTAK